MENRKSIPLIVLAVFSIVILLANGNMKKIYALEIIQKATGDIPRSVDGSQVSNLTAVLNSNDDTISVYDSTNGNLLRTIDFSPAFSAIGAGVANHIACAPLTLPYCMTFVDTTTTDRIFMININNGQVGTLASGINITSSAPLSGGYAFEINCDAGQNQCTVWIFRDSAAAPAGSVRLRVYSTTVNVFSSAWTFVAEYDTGLSTGNDIGSVEHARLFNINGDFYNMLAYFHDGTAFRVFNLGTGTQACSIASGLITNPEIQYADTTSGNDYWLWQRDGTGLSKVTMSSPTACVIDTTISVTQFESNNPVALSFNTNTNNFYVAVASGSIYEVNGTTLTTQIEYTTSATIIRSSMFYDDSLDVLASAINTDDVVNFFYFQTTVSGEGGGDEACFDINDSPDTTTLVCYPDEDGDGIPDLPGGVFGGLNPTRNITSSAQFLCENLGLCEDGSDIRFNGLGYFIVAIGLGILIAMFFLASGGDLHRIPTFVWFIGTLAVVGSLTGFGFVDITFFIIGILVIIALASAKILSTLELGGFK